MKTFSFTGAKKIVFGNGSFTGLAERLTELKVSRPLVVLDGNLAGTGLGERLSGLLDQAKIGFVLYDKAVPEPPLELADEGAKLAIRKRCDGVVGIGGGSAMDLAKAIAVLAANKGKAEDYLGLNKVPGPGLPKIMVPTTAGTGSEVTFTAVFIRKKLKKKEGMNSPYLYPELALLDPELTLTLPPHPTAATGVDALCHAIESYTSINASPMSELLSLEAIRLISDNLRTAVHDGTNLEAREAMLLGSLYAGLGLANAGVTAVHSLSYPLGGKYGISHGLANTIMLPRVMAFNLSGAQEKFVDIAEIMGEIVDDLPLREAACLAVEAVEALIEDCGIFTTLEELEIPEADFPELAKVAMTVARPLANNPCKMTPEEMVEIYQECY
ncbi:MAG: alcohol dehydrogenase [Syntrophobacterales bacterium CG_4_8_14_3_um_filter_58_8]|nr:MAG: alcohol dehydrogenase [Syntrophaceae bacterium CG2_30_58_14]PIV01485.1 MAG: alcohol dehydrogenase [Syntrophobacterales bacterium CG03_land_8_20_14_0_80_58_14]PJC72796.1 MAG: alcohol dehydrogenase [Syntrophobacterales bacterium CG_4_8_14_3_um_filter_58_8]